MVCHILNLNNITNKPMENKQQTAVDYFFDKIKSNFEHDGDKLESVMFLYAICKEKEREQHVSAYSHGWHDGQDEIINRIAHIDKGGDESGLNHYNQTYGTEPSR